MDLDPSVLWDFAGEIVGTFTARAGGTRATVTRIDNDGTVWARTAGGTEAPASSVGAGVEVGDEVELSWDGARMSVAANVSSPPASGRATHRGIASSREAADKARAIAEATGQHFFADDNGVHVSTEDGNPTGAQNILMNALGMLIRKGKTWRAAFTETATSFYDGLGNAAENIMATFGADGATIGYANGAHMSIGADGIEGTNSDGMTVLDVASEADTGSTLVEKRIGDVLTWSVDQTATESVTADIIERYAVATGGGIVVTLKCVWTVSGGATMDVTQRYTFTDGTASTASVLAAGNDIGMTLAYDGGTTVTLTSVPHTSANVTAGEVTLATVAYEADSVPMPAFTLGTRAGDAQGFSYAMGDGIETASEHQAVFGQYNSPSATDLFQIGDGTLTARHNAFSIDEDGNVTATGRFWGGKSNKRLWSGSYYMDAGHTATLSEHVRDQPNGIVLVWSAYVNGSAQNYDWNFVYIPKGWVANWNGNGLSCVMARAGLAAIAVKYVTINEGIMGSTTITGYSRNVASGTACGINYNNTTFVLREVWGV